MRRVARDNATARPGSGAAKCCALDMIFFPDKMILPMILPMTLPRHACIRLNEPRGGGRRSSRASSVHGRPLLA